MRATEAPLKYLCITTIVTDDPGAVLAQFRAEHRTGAFTIHLSQGGLSRIEWTETLRLPLPSRQFLDTPTLVAVPP